MCSKESLLFTKVADESLALASWQVPSFVDDDEKRVVTGCRDFVS